MQIQELPALASLIKNAAAEIGINVYLKIEDPGAYYGDAVPGKSDWLDSEFGMTDYGHRGIPNVFLTAPLKSDGTWNAANFQNAEYDKLVDDYVAALDLSSQQDVAGKIQRLLLDETPIIYPYFYDYLTATCPNVAGVQPTAMGQLFLQKARRSADARGIGVRALPRCVRLALSLLTLWLVSVVVFLGAQVLPGDPGPGHSSARSPMRGRWPRSMRNSAPTGRRSRSISPGSAACCRATWASPMPTGRRSRPSSATRSSIR